MQENIDPDDDQSFSISCTQEIDEDVDVIWDWNSPQANNKISRVRFKKQTRLYPPQSPKLTVKRHTSNTQIPKFDKLKEEVEALREELTGTGSKQSSKKQICIDDFNDDSFDEQLVLCSQRVENEFINKFRTNSNVELNRVNETCDIKMSSIDNLLHGTLQNTSVSISPSNDMADDSFDLAIKDLIGDDFESTILQQMSNDVNEEPAKLPEAEDFCNNNQHTFTKHSSFEILSSHTKDVSPIKCSPEEIEQKRLQALAKLNAKKGLTVIEKNRQEAIKRLQMNRQRRIQQGQSTSFRRTHSSSR